MFYLSSMAFKPVSVPVLLQQPDDEELPEDIDTVCQIHKNKSKNTFCDLIGKIKITHSQLNWKVNWLASFLGGPTKIYEHLKDCCPWLFMEKKPLGPHLSRCLEGGQDNSWHTWIFCRVCDAGWQIILKFNCEWLKRLKLCLCSHTAVSGTSCTSSLLRRPTRSLSQTLEHTYFLQCPDLLAGFPSLDPLRQGRAPCVNF